MSNLTNVLNSLNSIYNIKNDIKSSLENRGINMNNVAFNAYPDKVDSIKSNLSAFTFSWCMLNNLDNELMYIYNTALVTNSSNMFVGCQRLTSLPNIDVSNSTETSSMFESCLQITNMPSVNMINTINAAFMFRQCWNMTGFPELVTGNNLHNTVGMFYSCNNLVDVGIFNTHSVTGMFSMFSKCYNLVNVSVFDTSSVINMSSMFSDCNKLSLDSISNICLMCINSNIVSSKRNLYSNNQYSPLYNTIYNKFTFSNLDYHILSDLKNAGWSFPEITVSTDV